MDKFILVICIIIMFVATVFVLFGVGYYLYARIWCLKEERRIQNEYRCKLYEKLYNFLEKDSVEFTYDEFLKFKAFKDMENKGKE